MTDAWKKTLRDVAIILLIGFVYYLIYIVTGWGLPCTFKSFTGLPCPSCGITHMVVDLIRLDFRSAFNDNQFLFLTWPLVAAEIIYILYRLESGKDLPKINIVFITAFTVLLFIYGFLRILFSW